MSQRDRWCGMEKAASIFVAHPADEIHRTRFRAATVSRADMAVPLMELIPCRGYVHAAGAFYMETVPRMGRLRLLDQGVCRNVILLSPSTSPNFDDSISRVHIGRMVAIGYPIRAFFVQPLLILFSW